MVPGLHGNPTRERGPDYCKKIGNPTRVLRPGMDDRVRSSQSFAPGDSAPAREGIGYRASRR